MRDINYGTVLLRSIHVNGTIRGFLCLYAYRVKHILWELHTYNGMECQHSYDGYDFHWLYYSLKSNVLLKGQQLLLSAIVNL